MNKRRYSFGLTVTIAWLAGVGWIAWTNSSDFAGMKPNEWGDFLSGAFAPLAFLWLVIGYLQQGEELRLSTKALLLQAEELKNSVEQQRELVEVSRLQVEGERAALAHQQQVQEEAIKPHFVVIASGGAFRGDGHSTYNVQISNAGSAVTNVRAALECGESTPRIILNTPMFDRGAQLQANFSLNTPYPEGIFLLNIHYRDVTGRDNTDLYTVTRESADPHSGLSIAKSAA